MSNRGLIQWAFLAVLLTTALLLFFLIQQATAQGITAGTDDRPASCRMTFPSDGRFVPPAPLPSEPGDGTGVFYFWFGTDKLWTSLPTDGTWPGLRPYQRGDSSYRQKILWWYRLPSGSPKNSSLTLTAKRLDGPALPVMDKFENFDPMQKEHNSAIMTAIDLPTPGCWEITGHHDQQELSFVVWVTASGR
jgi:hypothetical protein